MSTEGSGMIECRPGGCQWGPDDEDSVWHAAVDSGTRSRDLAAGDQTRWGPVWSVMRTLSELHGAENVRRVVWFH